MVITTFGTISEDISGMQKIPKAKIKVTVILQKQDGTKWVDVKVLGPARLGKQEGATIPFDGGGDVVPKGPKYAVFTRTEYTIEDAQGNVVKTVTRFDRSPPIP